MLSPGVDGRQRGRDPARLAGVRRVGARTDRDDAELFTFLEDGVADEIAIFVQAPDLEARRAGHAVTQGADLLAADVDVIHPEELHLGDRPLVELGEDLGRVRALDLVAVVTAHDGVAARVRGRTVVTDDVDLEAARLSVELQPVHGQGATDEHELVLREIEQDAVADDVTVIAHRHHLLRHLRDEVVEAVDRGVRAELQRVRALDGELGHVVRLIEQHGAVAPRGLLIAPVVILGRHYGINVGANAGIAQHVDRVTGCLQHFLKVLHS